jgi:hypothetical protein
MNLTQLTAWMAEHGVERSREEWYRRCKAGQFGGQPGDQPGTQWLITLSEAEKMLARLKEGA